MQFRDLIEILAEYDVVHSDLPRNFNCDGEVDHEYKKIYINTNQSYKDKIDTTIHELLHVFYDSRGIEVTENQIIEETKQIIKREYE